VPVKPFFTNMFKHKFQFTVLYHMDIETVVAFNKVVEGETMVEAMDTGMKELLTDVCSGSDIVHLSLTQL
jgi:hypothetical protein